MRFQQLVELMNEFEEEIEIVSPIKAKEEMIILYQKDINLFLLESIEELDQISSRIVHELEVYFPTRFFAKYPRKSYLPSTL